jgi:hypothetical protein
LFSSFPTALIAPLLILSLATAGAASRRSAA